MAEKKNLVLGSALVALSVLPAQYLEAATINLDIRAEILSEALNITPNQSLNFDAFLSAGTGGTVRIDTAGTPTYTGVNSLASSAPTQAIIGLYGNNGAAVVLTVTDPTVTVNHTSLADSMVVNQFNIETNTGGVNQTVNMTANTITVPIGATLTVPAGRAAGNYTGSFNVQAVYQ